MDNRNCIEVLYFFLNVVSIQSNMSFSLLKVNHHDHAMTLDCRGYLLVFLMLLEITMLYMLYMLYMPNFIRSIQLFTRQNLRNYPSIPTFAFIMLVRFT